MREKTIFGVSIPNFIGMFTISIALIGSVITVTSDVQASIVRIENLENSQNECKTKIDKTKDDISEIKGDIKEIKAMLKMMLE